MPDAPRLLVIGGADLLRAVRIQCPDHEVSSAANLLDGVWRSIRDDFRTVILEYSGDVRAKRALETVREHRPNVHFLLCCAAPLEPRARELLSSGANGYLLMPLAPEEFQELIRQPARVVPGPDPVVVAPGRGEAGADSADLSRIADMLAHLGEGPQAAMARVGAMVRASLGASSVIIRYDRLVHVDGEPGEPLVQEPLRREQQVVGELALGRRATGTYDGPALARLSVLARLAELTLSLTRQQEQLRDLAWTDDLSGLRNRRFFDRRLGELIEQAKRERTRVTVLLFDIDEFKRYNDSFGHHVGDKLIQEVSQVLTQASRDSDVVARYGGDEFGVIFWDYEKPRVPGSQHPTEANQIAERLCRIIHEHKFECLGPLAPGPVTISGGLASFPWDGRDAGELMHSADDALLTAKRHGKNRIHLAGEGTQERCL